MNINEKLEQAKQSGIVSQPLTPMPQQKTPREMLVDAIRMQDAKSALELVDKFVAYADMLAENKGKKYAQEFINQFLKDQHRSIFNAMAVKVVSESEDEVDLNDLWESAADIANFQPELRLELNDAPNV